MSALKRKAGPLAESDPKKPKQQGTLTSFFGAPKTVVHGVKDGKAGAGEAAAPAPVFNKDKWVATLSEEQKKLLKLEIDTLDVSWLAHLKDEITSPYFLELKRFLDKEIQAGKKVFPPMADVYSWSRHTPFNTVKVAIIGQDPYHNVNQAHGLAFSVKEPTPAPPSLKNIYIALKKQYPAFEPPPNKGGLLIPWADRGVLMLNTCLTVRAHEAFSHQKRGWEQFTQKVIDLVAAKRTRGVVFIAWGTPAGMRVKKIDKARHLVLTGVHPSPLSAARGFFDCGHFRMANDWLIQRYGPDGEIDWALTPGTSTKSLKEEKKKAAKAKSEEEFEEDADAVAAFEEVVKAEAVAELAKEVKEEAKKIEADENTPPAA